MDNIRLQVIAHSPEQAEEINSLLRNAGINVRILYAGQTAEAMRQLKEFRPLLVIFHADCGKTVPVVEIAEMARLNGIFMAVLFSPEDPSVYLRALPETAAIGLHPSETDRLVDLVRMLASLSGASRAQDSARGEQNELQERFQLLLDSTSEAVAYLHQGLHVFANSAYLDALQLSDFHALASISLLDLLYSDEVDIKALVRDFAHDKYPTQPLSVSVRSPSGAEFEAQLSFAPVLFDGEQSVQMVLRKSGADADLQHELDRVRSLDPLSGLHHRRYFMDQLEYHLDSLSHQENGNGSAVFYLRPDGVASLIEYWDTADLDSYVTRLSGVIKGALNEGDLAGRIGETSFSFLAKRHHKGLLRQLGDAVRSGVELMPSGDRGVEYPASCSVGMVLLGPQIGTAEEALRQARSACRQAAEEGNALVRFRPSRRAPEDEDEGAQWVERLKYALNNDEFYSVQNTIMSLEGDSEGLFENRTYLHEEDRDIDFDEYGPAADRADLASTIDRLVIPGLLRVISGTGDRHFINVSGNSVQDFSFPSWFHRQLQEFDVQGSQLVLQVSVDTANANLRATRRMFEELGVLGCSFSVSHFDDHKPSIELLEKLDLSFVKLPPGLSADLAQHPTNQSVIRNVAAAAAVAGVSVFADEVNNPADMALLWQCGVKLVSGEFLQDEPRVIGQ